MCNLHKITHVRTYMAQITLVSRRQVRVTDVLLGCIRTSFTKHISIYCKSIINIALLLVASHKISDVLTFNLHGIIDGYSQLKIITNEKMFKESKVADKADWVKFNGTKTIKYKLKRCSNKECCKCRYVMFKGTITKWPVQKLAQGTTQKLLQYHDATDI